MPLVSFIIPSYNAEKYIKSCIDSITSQTYKDFEIIVVDDESADMTLNVVRGLQRKHSNIKVIEAKHNGPGNARNIGAQHANGKYIMFVDADDYFISKDMLKETSKYLLDKNYDMIKIQAIKEDADGKVDDFWFNIQEPFVGNGVNALKKVIDSGTVFCPVWLYFIKKEYFVENNFKFNKSRFHEDYGLMPLVILKCQRFMSLPKVYYSYCQRPSSIMTTKSEDMQERKANDLLFFYDYLMKELKSFKLDEEDRLVIEGYFNNMTTLQFKYFYTKQYEGDLKQPLIERGLYENEGDLKRKLMEKSENQ
jgi:glycosyltransferase involved in cell wall biosynthesis